MLDVNLVWSRRARKVSLSHSCIDCAPFQYTTGGVWDGEEVKEWSRFERLYIPIPDNTTAIVYSHLGAEVKLFLPNMGNAIENAQLRK